MFNVFWFMFDVYDVVLSMMGRLICDLINMGHVNEVSEFLGNIILNCEDDRLADFFVYIYSHFSDAEELFVSEIKVVLSRKIKKLKI